MHELFPGQNTNEKIYIAVREHPVLLLIKVVVWLFFVLVLILFRNFVPDILPALFEGTAGTIISVVQQVYILFLALSLFIIFVLYYLNLHIVTEMRIVDIDQKGLFKHVVSILNIAQIEDVTSDTTGILGTVFDYGTVFIQTAGTRERFELQNVPHPGQLSKIIIDLFEQQQGHSLK
jgi:hypothetical protein